LRRTPLLIGGILLVAAGAVLIGRRASLPELDDGFVGAGADTAARVEASRLTAEDSVVAAVTLPRFGDFDSMLNRRIVRVLVSPNQTHYFLDQGTPRGLSVDAAALFEAELNRKHRTGSRPVRVMLIPVQQDELLPSLLAGRGDIVASGLTITPERKARADFSNPTFRNVSEIVVTGPASPNLGTLDDLAGQEVFVRRSSSYYESLQRLNAGLRRRGLAPVRLRRRRKRWRTRTCWRC
jgi:ABC-type amino acid transport substrate-binding protein